MAAAPLFLRHVRAADTPRFGLGVASGFPRPDRLVLWTRLLGSDLPAEVAVTWEVAEDEAFTQVRARGVEQAVEADAHSVHAEPAGLAPGRLYWYRFTALGQRSETGRTRTAPSPDTLAPLRIVLASCQRWDHGHYAAWRQAVTDQPDLVLFVGDYIYEYPAFPGRVRSHTGGEVVTLGQYRDRYALYKSDPLLRAAHAAAPWAVVWDDHEVDNDYAGNLPGKPSLSFDSRRSAAYQAYWEHMPFPKAARPRNGTMRIHGTLDWGRSARIVLVDDRQYRDPQACPKTLIGHGSNTVSAKDCPALLDPKRSLLGAAQEAWLADAWSTEHRWNILAQQTLMAPMSFTDPSEPAAPRLWTDGWSGYGPARERLLGVLAERRIPGALVLGGDVHAHYVADLAAPAGGSAARVVATEFCGTSISSNGMAQKRLDAELPNHPHIRYGRSEERGYVLLDIQADCTLATLRAVERPDDVDSPVRVSATFAVAQDRPGAQPA